MIYSMSEKDLKQSEIDVHKATIERLKAQQAPAITRDLEQMTRTADDYAEKKRELEKQVAILGKENQAAQAMLEMANTVGIASGSLEPRSITSHRHNCR
jgi:tellurite resistance protein